VNEVRKSTARHIAERKLTINKDVNVKVKQLQRQLVKLQFSGRTVSNRSEERRVGKEYKERG